MQQVRSYQELKAWDIELVKTTYAVSEMRAEYAEALRPEIEKTCQFFLPEIEIGLSFHQGWEKGRIMPRFWHKVLSGIKLLAIR